jgi:pyrroloquinoline quinone biosynthesis protein B
MRARARTQSSIAIGAGAHEWVLINASPDILTQIRAFPGLQPARRIRDTGIVAVILMDAQIDHVTGLLMLREGGPLHIYCTDVVREELISVNPIFNILGHYCTVAWHPIILGPDAAFSVAGLEALRFVPVPLKSKAPPYSRHRDDPHEGDNIGLQVTDTRSNATLFYAPGLAEIEPHLQSHLRDSDCLLIDGTCWTDDELVAMGISRKRSRDMGHLPQSGDGGMLSVLAPLKRPRKVLIHINNTNPILNEDSPERAALAAAGIEAAYDGLEIVL